MRQRKVPAAMAERVHNYYNYILRRQVSSEQSFIMEGGCLGVGGQAGIVGWGGGLAGGRARKLQVASQGLAS